MKTLKFNCKDSFGRNCSKTNIHVLSFSVDKDSNLKVTDGYGDNWFHLNISKLEVFDEPEEKEFDRYVVTDNNQTKWMSLKVFQKAQAKKKALPFIRFRSIIKLNNHLGKAKKPVKPLS